MGHVYAYLRVSTDAQDVENQRLGIREYCRQRGFEPVYFEDTASGRIDWRQREIGKVIEKVQPGDVLVVSEVSRLARSTIQVLEIMREAAEKSIALHVVKSGMVMDGSLSSKITATVLALAGEIEREMISARTKEALKKRKEAGVRLGRPPGKKVEVLKLDKHSKTIDEYMKKGVSMTSICKICDVSAPTLYYWLERRRPELREQRTRERSARIA